MAKIVHNRKNCIGCHACVAIAPQSWTIDEKDGKSNVVGGCPKRAVIVADVMDCDIEANQAAAEACPVNIIKVEK